MRANDAESVSSVVGVGGVPVPIPTRIVDALMAIADDDSIVATEDRTATAMHAREGDRFQFSEVSTFRGFVGQIENMSRLAKCGEIDVRVEMLRAVRTITVSPEDIGEILDRRAG